MSYNGSGTFSINTAGQPVVTATTISSTVFNALTADLATGLTTCILKDGTQTTTAVIPFAAGLSLTGTASNITTGSNFISNGGTDAGLSFDASNNATFSANLIVSGAGPHAIGTTTNAAIGVRVTTTAATAGSGTAAGLHIGPTITATGNNVGLMGFGIGVVSDDTTFATGTATGLEAVQLRIGGGASMVKTGTGTIDNAAAFIINDAPTIGTANYAAWIKSGNVRFDTGILRVNDSGAAVATGWLRVLASDTDYVSRLQNSNAAPLGVSIYYSGAAPNGTGNMFIKCEDTGAERFSARSNGGLANFSANNVNLSTREVKNDLQVYDEARLLSYERFLEDVDHGYWKYKDQDHSDYNHGPTVEGVRAALRKHDLHAEEQSLIDVFDAKRGLEGLATHDLINIAIASLVASNRRLRARLDKLENH